jgi:hypothetical protein
MSSSLLQEDFYELHPSRPASPWSTLSSIFYSSGPPSYKPRAYSHTQRPSDPNTYTWASRIPVLAINSTRRDCFYSDIRPGGSSTVGESEFERGVESEPPRFSDPPPTLKDLHAEASGKRSSGSRNSGRGIGEESRVWREYVDESEEWDREMIKGLDGSLDVLLIFVSRIIEAHF